MDYVMAGKMDCELSARWYNSGYQRAESSPIPDYESHFGGTDRTYSWRNAIIGSTLVARHAGR
jgi:hypothetical protein